MTIIFMILIGIAVVSAAWIVVSHTVTITCQTGSGVAVTSSNTYTADAENNIRASFGIVTNQLIAFTADVSQQKNVYILSSTNATLCTNDTSGGSPAKTITLIGGQAIEWNSTNGQTNPFGAVDITSLYFTCAAAADLTLLTLVDPTV